jgi:hypothetical protein
MVVIIYPRNKFDVMPGLDPGIHDDGPHMRTLRKDVRCESHHGLPGQARQ